MGRRAKTNLRLSDRFIDARDPPLLASSPPTGIHIYFKEIATAKTSISLSLSLSIHLSLSLRNDAKQTSMNVIPLDIYSRGVVSSYEIYIFAKRRLEL